MKKKVLIIFSLSLCLVVILNINTYWSRIDKSYSLALSNIEAIASNENSGGEENGSGKVLECSTRAEESPVSRTFAYLCLYQSTGGAYCSQPIRGYHMGAMDHCRVRN